MGSLNPFKKPDVPKLEPVEPIDNSAALAEAAAAEEVKRKEQRGRAATILTQQSAKGEDSYGLGTKALLGG